MNEEMKRIAIGSGLLGFGIGGLIATVGFGKKIIKLERKNQEWSSLYKQLIDDVRTDLGDETLTGLERWERHVERLNFITAVKSM